MSKIEYAWTQPVSELDKEARILRAMVDALHTRIEAVEKFTRTLDSTLARNIDAVADLERATTARTAPLDEDAIRKDERERWANTFEAMSADVKKLAKAHGGRNEFVCALRKETESDNLDYIAKKLREYKP